MELIVGIFMFLILFALAFITIILSSESYFADRFYYDVVFEDVMGLSEGDKVMVRGFEVGSVKALWLKSDGVHVRASLKDRLRLRKGYTVEILSSSVLGGRYLQFSEGTGDYLEIGMDTRLYGTKPVDLMTEAGRIFSKMEEALVEGGILDNLKTRPFQTFSIVTRLVERVALM